MENFINGIGGYHSWQFYALAFGLLSVGMGLRAWKVYFIPVPALGSLLLALAINHEVLALPSSLSPLVLGLAGTIPFLFGAISLVGLLDPTVIYRVFFGGINGKEK